MLNSNTFVEGWLVYPINSIMFVTAATLEDVKGFPSEQLLLVALVLLFFPSSPNLEFANCHTAVTCEKLQVVDLLLR